MSIDKKLMDKELKVKSTMQYLYYSPESLMMCNKCKGHLGLWRMVSKALFKKKKQEYIVICKRCGYENIRVKGEIAKQIDKRWV